MKKCDCCGHDKYAIYLSWGKGQEKLMNLICENSDCTKRYIVDTKCKACRTIKNKLNDHEIREGKFICNCGQVCNIIKSEY